MSTTSGMRLSKKNYSVSLDIMTNVVIIVGFIIVSIQDPYHYPQDYPGQRHVDGFVRGECPKCLSSTLLLSCLPAYVSIRKYTSAYVSMSHSKSSEGVSVSVDTPTFFPTWWKMTVSYLGTNPFQFCAGDT